MAKKMLINATHPEENRVAIVDDGILTELDIEIAGKEQTKGNIYKATVIRVETGLQAAFVDYGAERLGFLQMGEIHPSLIKDATNDSENKARPRINDILRRGQELLVQVVKEERGTKGAALTTFLSLPGRYMVLMPGSTTKGVSRKIEEEAERKKLKETMASLDLPEKMGYIVRTAGIGQDRNELKRDFDYLVRVYENILVLSKKAQAPALIYQESNLVIRSIRDYFSTEMDEVLVDDLQCLQQAKDFFQAVMPEFLGLVKLHQERRPIFSRYQIEEQIDTLARNKVLLPSGGSIVIDTTEALVAIDVNSGKMASEQGVEGTAYKTNLEAAKEAARQLRLRDLGGLIVIDFIDMRDRKHIRDIEKMLKDSMKNDKARVTIGRISQFGLLEMSRQRIKAALAEASYLACPHCNGSGRVKSTEAQAVSFLRKVHTALAKGQIDRVEGETPLDVAGYLLNNKREELVDMERRYQTSIFIRGRGDFLAGQSELVTRKREKIEVSELITEAVRLETLVATPAEQEEIAEIEPTETADTAEVTKKKKRKRRKKKKGSELSDTTEAGEESKSAESEEEEDDEETQPDTIDQAQAPDEEPALETAEAVAPGESAPLEKKSSRRRRNRKRKPARVEPATTDEALEARPTTEEPVTPPAQTEPPPVVVMPEIETEKVATEASAPEARPSEEKKKPSRRRRSAKKTKEAEPDSVEGLKIEPKSTPRESDIALASALPTLTSEPVAPATEPVREEKTEPASATQQGPTQESIPAPQELTKEAAPKAAKRKTASKKTKTPAAGKTAAEAKDNTAPEVMTPAQAEPAEKKKKTPAKSEKKPTAAKKAPKAAKASDEAPAEPPKPAKKPATKKKTTTPKKTRVSPSPEEAKE